MEEFPGWFLIKTCYTLGMFQETDMVQNQVRHWAVICTRVQKSVTPCVIIRSWFSGGVNFKVHHRKTVQSAQLQLQISVSDRDPIPAP